MSPGRLPSQGCARDLLPDASTLLLDVASRVQEGKLFPEGWDQMPLPQKVSEVYLGQRGMLFWANKAAMASSITVGVLWVLFRLVLPALGIISLPGDRM